MTMSVGMKAVHEKAKEYDKKLRSDDPRFMRSVKVVDEDGSTMMWNCAFILKHDEDKQKWILVFTEHHDFHVFDANSLMAYDQYGPQPIIECFEPDK